MSKITFALYFGNRGFFPETLIASARDEMMKAVTDAGYGYLIADADMTRYGAVETREEGLAYAAWLKNHMGEYDGIILCLPNFGDENGAVLALQDCGVPILIQAYPDEIGKMDFAHRRDAYCGKFSIEDVFYQYGIPFTALQPHVAHPLSDAFRGNLDDFAAVCRVANGMRRFNIGAIGARTTKFKTVRYDEITLQKYGITVEAFDLSELFMRVDKYADDNQRVIAKRDTLLSYMCFDGVPGDKILTLAKTGVVIDDFIDEYQLQCVAIRCWEEMQAVLGIAPCVLLSELNERGIVASCEVDLCSAINMYSMQLAAQKPASCLDWNNNYGDVADKVILFHCGPVAQSLLKGKSQVIEHKMFAKGNPGCGWGSSEQRMAEMPITYANCKTENGKLVYYVDEGRITGDEVEKEFFGCCGVAEINNLEAKLIKLGRSGFRHHTAVGAGHQAAVLREAFDTYLGYDRIDLD